MWCFWRCSIMFFILSNAFFLINFNTRKNVYYNEKNHFNNICVIAMFNASCYNKTWGNRYMQQQKILLP